MYRRIISSFLVSLFVLTALPAFAASQEPVGRLIVGLKKATLAQAADAQVRIKSLSSRTGIPMHIEHSANANVHAVSLFMALSEPQLESTLSSLRKDPTVEYAVADRKVKTYQVPNDPIYTTIDPNSWASGQWYLWPAIQSAAGLTQGSINAQGAWDLTIGSNNLVIAVVDSGVLFDHPDLGRAANNGRLLPGYDFVSANSDGSFATANDGDGWDSDPTDPGDWVSTADSQSTGPMAGCAVSDSEWHGTRVAGMIGAQANNGIGIAGVTWSGWIQPVRALGKCGGFESDAIFAMLWAANIPIEGAPVNPYPANIINISWGAAGSCDQAFQSTVNQIRALGIAIVAASGNGEQAVSEPANCTGVIAVAAVASTGSLVDYSNYGPEVTLSAPGGNCCQFSEDTTTNLGTTVATTMSYTSQLPPLTNEGTSFSAPLVSGVAGLMLSVNGNLTPDQLSDRLQTSSQVFPTNQAFVQSATCAAGSGLVCACTTSNCGAGILDAQAAVVEAQRPIAALSASFIDTNVMQITAAGSSASCGRTIASYTWSADSASSVSSTSGAIIQAVLPSSLVGTITLIVTDNLGAIDTVTVNANNGTVTTDAPVSAGTHACLPAIVQPAGSSMAAGGPIPPGSLPTPVVPAPPTPTLTMAASPTTVTSGGSSTITWTGTFLSTCNNTGGWAGQSPETGSMTVNPTVTTTYTLSCTGGLGSASQSVTITVPVAAPTPPTSSPTPVATSTAGSGKGGGGAMDPWTLAGVALLVFAARLRKSAGPTQDRAA